MHEKSDAEILSGDVAIHAGDRVMQYTGDELPEPDPSTS